MKKIIIGVTQFGMHYGITNKSHYNKKKKLNQILNFSKKKNIRALYTSKYYGNSNKLLSLEDLSGFEIFLKFKSEDLLNDKFFLELNEIKSTLKKNSLVLMIDGFEKLNIKKSEKIYNILLNLRKKKYISKFGYSIYFFKNLKKTCKKFKPDILQCPYNVLDRRLEKNNLIAFLKKNKIEIHVRTIFLQGLLIQDYSLLPNKFLRWKKIFKKFNESMSYYNVSNLKGCLNFIDKNKYINKILVGVDNLDHLKEIVNFKRKKNMIFPRFDFKNEKLINPSKW